MGMEVSETCAAVFIGHNLAHEATRGLGNGVQNGLGQAVTQGGVQPLTVYLVMASMSRHRSRKEFASRPTRTGLM